MLQKAYRYASLFEPHSSIMFIPSVTEKSLYSPCTFQPNYSLMCAYETHWTLPSQFVSCTKVAQVPKSIFKKVQLIAEEETKQSLSGN